MTLILNEKSSRSETNDDGKVECKPDGYEPEPLSRTGISKLKEAHQQWCPEKLATLLNSVPARTGHGSVAAFLPQLTVPVLQFPRTCLAEAGARAGLQP